MASERIFKKSYANGFKGIDGQSSSIEIDTDSVNRAVNYEMSVGNSLRGRVGCQTSGSHGFFAIFPYRYTRTQDQYNITYQVAAGAYPTQTPGLTTTKTAADGASIEKLIALNQQVWTLDTMSITVTQTNAGTYTWYSYVTGSNINFKILKNGVSILDTSLVDGVTSSTSIYSLLSTIDALADLAISRTTRGTCPPYGETTNAAVATIGTATYGTRYRITCSAHNFQAGDILTWTDSSILKGGFVTEVNTAGTNITYVGPSYQPGTGDVLGYMGQPATNFPISTISSETSGALTISFPYWRLIPEGDRDFGHIYDSAYAQWSAKSISSFYAPPVAVNASGNLYLAASGQTSAGSSTWANNLIKVDGLTAVRAGLPTPIIDVTSPGAGALTGLFSYKAFLRRVDAQGNITDGPVSDVFSITYAAGYGRITYSNDMAFADFTGFGARGCYKNTNESPASGSSFYVDDNTASLTAFLQPGDPICLTDNTPQKVGLWKTTFGAINLGTLHRTVCTAYTAIAATISPTSSSIKVADSSGYQINDNTEISTGLTIVVLRTTVGGVQYYKLAELPVVGYGDLAFFDNVTDAALIVDEQYIEIEVGKEHNPPPPCTLVAQHQGGLVTARGPLTPNTVGFSTVDGIEYFPTASNALDVPATQSGFITAIASDTDDRLAVFKERAYYDVVGDLDGGTFSVNVRNEGDYGIVSQASLVRANGVLIGLSKNGWVTIKDGQLDPYRFMDVSARVMNQSYQWGWATAVNDYFNRQYICVIPQVTGEPVSFAIDYSRGDVKTLERSYATKIDQAGGMAMVGDTLYHLSQTSPYGVFRRLTRFSSNSPSGNGDGDSFIDNTGAISYILETQPINFGEPGQLKSPIRVRIWSIPNDYVVEGWVPFSSLVELGASAIASYVVSGNPGVTYSSVSFTASTDVYKDVKLTKSRGFFFIFRLTTNTIRTAPFITGYEIMFAANYEKDDFQK